MKPLNLSRKDHQTELVILLTQRVKGHVSGNMQFTFCNTFEELVLLSNKHFVITS